MNRDVDEVIRVMMLLWKARLQRAAKAKEKAEAAEATFSAGANRILNVSAPATVPESRMVR